VCIYYATEVLLNLSPSTLEFCLIMYFILYVCHLMVNENNSCCFKWSSIQLLLDSKIYPFFSLFVFFQLQCDRKLQRGKMSAYSLQLVWVCSSCKTCCEKRSKLNRSNSVLCCRGASCDLRDSNRKNPSSNSQCQIALGINQHRLGNSAFQHQQKPKYF